MPRTARATPGGYIYHVLNRGNARRPVFHKDADYAAFVRLLKEAQDRIPVRILAYSLMPKHFHLAVRPRRPADWLGYVNEPKTEAEVNALKKCLARGRPYGTESWTADTAGLLGLKSSLRPRGRPRKVMTERSLFNGLESESGDVDGLPEK